MPLSKVYTFTDPPSSSKPTASNNKDEILTWLQANGQVDADASKEDFSKDDLVELLEDA